MRANAAGRPRQETRIETSCRRRSTRRWSIRMCQNFWPMLSGALCAGVAALLTALKTGDVLVWPCALLIIAVGTLRAFQMRNYQNAHSGADGRAGEAMGSALPDRRDGLRRCRSACGAWSPFSAPTIRRAYALHRGHGRLHRRRRRPATTAGRGIVPAADAAGLRADVAGAGAARRHLLLRRPRRAAGAVLLSALQADQPQSARDLRQRAVGRRARSRAGQPVRHRPEQHAAWPVHVPRPTAGSR